MVSFSPLPPQWLFKFCTFILNHIGKGEAVLHLIGVLWHFCVISACTNDFLLFFSFPAFSFFLPASHLPCFTLLSLYFLLNFSAYCSSPCLFSCSDSPGGSKDYHWARARAPASCPAHSDAGWPYHNAFDQTDTDRCHAKRNSSPYCCNSSSRARGWVNLHTLRIPLHVGTSYINPWVSYWT